MSFTPTAENAAIYEELRAAAEQVAELNRELAEAETLAKGMAQQLKALEAERDEARAEYAADNENAIARGWLTPEQAAALRAEAARLREAIREHAAQKRDDRCWLDDAALYSAAGLSPSIDANTALPPREEFLANCARFHASRQHPGHVYETQAEHDARVRAKALEPIAAVVAEPLNFTNADQMVDVVRRVRALAEKEPTT